MSLINKMLRDLDTRLDKPDGRPGSNLENLRPAEELYKKSGHKRLWLVLAAVVLLSSTSIAYTYVYVYNSQLPWSKLSVVAKSGSTSVGNTSGQQNTPKSVQTSPLVQSPLSSNTAVVATKAIASARTPEKIATAVSVPTRAKQTRTTKRIKARRKKIRARRTHRARLATRSVQSNKRKKPVTTKIATAMPVPDKLPKNKHLKIGETVTTGQGFTKKAKPATPQQRAELRYQAALTNIGRRQSSIAEKQLREALLLSPGHIMARELLVSILIKNGHWPEAEKLLQQGMRLAPQHYRFAQQLARLTVERGDDASAIKLLETSAPYGKKDPDYIALLATLYQRVGQHNKAVEAFGLALRIQPQQGRWWLAAAVSLEAQQQWGAAREAYQRAAVSTRLSNDLIIYAQQRLKILKNK